MTAVERMGLRADRAAAQADGAWQVLRAMPCPWPAEAEAVWDRLERRATRRQRAWQRLFLAQNRRQS